MITINTVNALCAAGKTEAAKNQLIQLANLGYKFLFILPTKEAIDEWYGKTMQLAPSCLQVTRIDGDHKIESTVSKSIIEHTKKSAPDVGEILFITHSAFLDRPYMHNSNIWTVLFDEVSNVALDLSISVPKEAAILLDHVTTKPVDLVYSEMFREDHVDYLDMIATNKMGDQVHEIFAPIAKTLMNNDWRVFVETTNFNRIKEGSGDDDTDHQLRVYACMEPTAFVGFKQVIIMSALFDETLPYLMWRNQVNFKSYKKIENKLRYTEHKNGANLTIHYLFNKKFSKKFRNECNEEGVSNWQSIINRIETLFSDSRFLYVVNNDADRSLRGRFERGVRISSVCHSINGYSHYSNLVHLAALNPQPAFHSFIAARYDINTAELHRAIYLHPVYQFIMRGTLRDPNSTQPVNVVVADKDAADYLHNLFPNSTIKKVDGLQGINDKPYAPKKRVWRTEAMRVAATRLKHKLIKDLQLHDVDPKLTLFAHVHQSIGMKYDVDSVDSFLQQMKNLHEEMLKSKSDNILISAAIYDDNHRKLDKVKSVWGIWLDNDDGSFTPDHFRAVFPNMRFVAYSTFSANGRYRIVIPTTKAMPHEIAKKIKDLLMEALRIHKSVRGEYKETTPYTFFGFDSTKMNNASLFYMPGQNEALDDVTQHAWNEYEGPLLDPEDFLNNPLIANAYDPEPEYEPVKIEVSDEKKQQRIDKAIATYKAVPVGQKLRHGAFLGFARRLQLAGCDDNEIRSLLRANATDAKRLKQIPGVIKTIRNSPPMKRIDPWLR